MAMRSGFGPAYSEYAGFLFAPIGEDARGQPLTVLSVLARLGLDPDAEARRLAALPHEAATQAVVAWIGDLPEGSWTAMDARLIAARLLAALPSRRARLTPSAADSTPTPAAPARSSTTMRWLVVIAFAGMVAFAIWNMQGKDPDYMDLSLAPSRAPALALRDAAPSVADRPDPPSLQKRQT